MELTVLKDPEFKVDEFEKLKKRLTDSDVISELTFLGNSLFDERTNIGPYYGMSYYMPNLGLAEITELSANAGMNSLMVNGAWNSNLRLYKANVRGKKPNIVGFGGMNIHYAALEKGLGELDEIGEEEPLSVVGGHLGIYTPWLALQAGADFAISGEAPTWLQFAERLVSNWRPGQNIRRLALEMAQEFEFNDIPGISYLWQHPRTGQVFMANTGRAKLLMNLDHMPSRLDTLRHFEPPHKYENTHGYPLPIEDLKKYIKVVSLETSHGCQHHCDFCPLTPLSHGKSRTRSPAIIVHGDMIPVYEATGLDYYFGTDDNAGMNIPWFRRLLEELRDARVNGKRLREVIRAGTEITLQALALNLDLFPIMKETPMREYWVGQEDYNVPAYANKGQTIERNIAVHLAAKENGVHLRLMTIKTDDKPSTTRKLLPKDAYAHQKLFEADELERQKWENLAELAGMDPKVDGPTIVELGKAYRELRTERNLESPAWMPVISPINEQGLLEITDIEDTSTSILEKAKTMVHKAKYTLSLKKREDADSEKERTYIQQMLQKWPQVKQLLEWANSLRGINGKYGDEEEIMLANKLGGKYGGRSLQRLMLTISTGSNFWEGPYEDNMVLGKIGNIKIEDYHFDGNRLAVVSKNNPDPAKVMRDVRDSLHQFYNLQKALPLFFRGYVLGDSEAREYFDTWVIGKWQLYKSKKPFMEHLKALEEGPIERDAPMQWSPWPIISFGEKPHYPYNGATMYRAKVRGEEAKLFVYPTQELIVPKQVTLSIA